MSLKIEIILPDEGGVSARSLDDHMAALGFARAHTALARLEAAQERMAELSAERPTLISPEAPAAETAPKATRTRKKADDKPVISTNPEDRRPPEDDEATQAQDAADEQAEVEAAREPGKLTREDLRHAVGRYVQKFGMAEATANIDQIIGCKQAEVPDTQEALAAAIAKVDAAVSAPVKEITVEDIFAEVGNYVAKFGEDATREDGIKIFADALGKPPGNEPYWKKTLLQGASQDVRQKALVAWKTAATAQTRYVAKE